jgi:hypothetical protein
MLCCPLSLSKARRKPWQLWRIARDFGTDGRPLFIVIGLRGVWGWRSKSTGKETGPTGERESVKGPLREIDFENTLMGSRVLKSYPSKKLRERFDRLEAEQQALGITFAYYTPGRSSDEDNHTPCRVHLFSRQFVAEAMIMAEEDPTYSSGKRAARARAFDRLIEEKSGVAHLKHPLKRRDPDKKIADGWKRTKGNLGATLERARRRGDSPPTMVAQRIEILPDWLIAEIKVWALREAGLATGPDSQTMNANQELKSNKKQQTVSLP